LKPPGALVLQEETPKTVTWIHMLIPFWLVVSTPLKNMKVSWDDDIPNIEK